MSQPMQTLLSQFSRVRTTPAHYKNPIQIDSAKIEKKKLKIHKELKKLKRQGKRVAKPIEEKFIWPKLRKEILTGVRDRKDKLIYDSDQLERDVLLLKRWGRYVQEKAWQEKCALERAMACQERALRKLKEESEDLYEQAIQLDDTIFGYKTDGPTETPPKENYDAPDGSYQDKTEYFIEEKIFIPDPKTKQAFTADQKKKAALLASQS